MRVALHNIHLLPHNLEFHAYVFELLRRRQVSVLYFSDPRGISFAKTLYRLRYKQYRNKYRGIIYTWLGKDRLSVGLQAILIF